MRHDDWAWWTFQYGPRPATMTALYQQAATTGDGRIGPRRTVRIEVWTYEGTRVLEIASYDASLSLTGRHRYSYDTLGRLTAARWSILPTPERPTIEGTLRYLYGPAGRLTAIEHAPIGAAAPERTEHFAFDAAGMLVASGAQARNEPIRWTRFDQRGLEYSAGCASSSHPARDAWRVYDRDESDRYVWPALPSAEGWR